MTAHANTDLFTPYGDDLFVNAADHIWLVASCVSHHCSLAVEGTAVAWGAPVLQPGVRRDPHLEHCVQFGHHYMRRT